MDQQTGQPNRKPAKRQDATDHEPRNASSDARKVGSVHGGGQAKPKKRRKPTSAIAVDLGIAALILVAFYLVNYGLPSRTVGKQLTDLPERAGTKASTPADAQSAAQTGADAKYSSPETPAETPLPKPTVDLTPWREKFADKFTTGAVEKTDWTYKSAKVNIRIDKVQAEDLVYFFADIYIADLACFRSAFAKRAEVMGEREPASDVANENGAILAINGDHCVDNNGPVIRNGRLFRDETFADALVLLPDGSMETYSADQLDMSHVIASQAWQVWTFGPMLLDNGQPKSEFNSTLNKANPRTAVGYFEPGHYCFLVVDGRQAKYSEGMTLTQLSQFFYEKGCTVAFNLDGGRSSEMVFLGKTINRPYDGGRATTDILMIVEE